MKAVFLNRKTYFTLAVVLLSAFLLVMLDGRAISFQGWVGYSLILGFGVTFILLTWRWVKTDEAPQGVLVAAFVAMGIRIVIGLVLIRALPIYGYDETPQRAGYVYADAYKRDTDAWARAKGEQPLVHSFTHPKVSDQYGGYLFLSAGLYRYLSPDAHRPLLITAIGSVIAALGTLYAWSFINQFFGRRAAVIAAWLMALYPEAVLLGASQMREPFLITSLAGSFASYSYWVNGHRMRSVMLAAFVALVLTLPITPPFVLIQILILGLGWVWEQRVSLRQTLIFLLPAVLLAFTSVYLASRSWGALEEISGTFWQVLIGWWEHTGGTWRVNLVTDQSLNLDVLFDAMPSWSHIPFLVLFGLAQPFLPAAIVAPGALLWRVIGIFRSVGWYLLLPFLLYAPLYAIRKKGWRSMATYLSLFVWITAMVASYRAPSYQWDNPRYRVIYLVMQVALVGWLWVVQVRERNPWVFRLGLSILVFCAIVGYWYLGNYTEIPSLSLSLTLTLAFTVATAIPLVGVLWDFLRRHKRIDPSVEV